MGTNRPVVGGSFRKLESAVKQILEDMFLVGDKVHIKETLEDTDHSVEDESANLHAHLLMETTKAKVGQEIPLQISLANRGRTPIFLTGIENVVPMGFELVDKPYYCVFDAAFLDLNKRQISPMGTEEIDLTLRPYDDGTFAIMPRINYFNGVEQQALCDPCCATFEVQENVLPNRVKTGYKDLDNLLLGGIPERSAVVLTSISCDERTLLVKRFLETGLKNSEVTFYFSIDATVTKTFAEEFPENFHLFLCNPMADAILTNLPNVHKLKGVENLTEINIALTSAIRRLKRSPEETRRACIGIVSDVLLQHHATQTRRWLTGLIAELRSRGFTTLAVLNPFMHTPEEVQAILDLFEGEISLVEKDDEKSMRIKKLLDQNYLRIQRSVSTRRLSTASLTRRGRWQRF